MRVLTTIQIWCYIYVQGVFVITKYGHYMLQYVTISSRFVTNVRLGVDMGYRVCKTMYIVYWGRVTISDTRTVYMYYDIYL